MRLWAFPPSDDRLFFVRPQACMHAGIRASWPYFRQKEKALQTTTIACFRV